jgi:hypothetical protein
MGPTDQLPEPPLSMSIPPSQGQRMRMTPPSTQLLRSSAPPCSARLVFLSEDVQNSRSIFPRQLRECLEQRQGVTSLALFRWSGNSGDQTEESEHRYDDGRFKRHLAVSPARLEDGFATSFPVGLFHPLQHAGLARHSPSCRFRGSSPHRWLEIYRRQDLI